MNIYSHENQFINNKYTKWYYDIIIKARSRNRKKNNGVYYEIHHILPSCYFHDFRKEKWNLVLLTSKEHYICHRLLTKITYGSLKHKMDLAIQKMMSSNSTQYRFIPCSRIFEIIKIQSNISNSLLKKGKPNLKNRGRRTGRTSEDFTKEWKENLSKAKILQNRGKDNPMYGKSHREDSRIKMSMTKKALAGTPGWNNRPPCSIETAEKIKIANTGKRWIHKKATKERKYVDPTLVADYVIVGWELGLGPRH